MLTVHRRHSVKCSSKKHLSTSDLDKCDCPLMLMGVDGKGAYHNREAIHTRDKFTAYRVCREIEEGKIHRPTIQAEEWTVERALVKYREIMTANRGWKPETVIAHEFLHRAFLRFTTEKKIKYLREVDVNRLMDWVSSWELGSNTKVVRVNNVKKFFDMAWRLGWIKDNPALILETPKGQKTGTTLPFNLETELPRIMDAIPNWEKGRKFTRRFGGSFWAKNPRVASGLLYLLRYTGLRISDAFLFNPNTLERRTVDGQETYCYFPKKQKKTDYPVFLPLSPEQVEPILKVCDEKHNPFWDGKTSIRDWNTAFSINCLTYLERVSGVANIHPHRFRDTFAVELLQNGVDIRSVSRLLGHSSTATTLRYYEHYLPADQDNLVRAMRKRRVEGVIQFPKQA